MSTKWLRTLLLALAAAGLTLAATGCDWVNLPGPW